PDLPVRQRVGFASGDSCRTWLGARVPVSTARSVGLLRADGRETLAGRIVFAAIRHGQPVWLIGRQLEPAEDADAADFEPLATAAQESQTEVHEGNARLR